jgi:hypothetical protein
MPANAGIYGRDGELFGWDDYLRADLWDFFFVMPKGGRFRR